jgi:hypothetical protein
LAASQFTIAAEASTPCHARAAKHALLDTMGQHSLLLDVPELLLLSVEERSNVVVTATMRMCFYQLQHSCVLL